MTIDRIGPADPIQPGRKPERANQASGSPKSDTISISSAAMEKAELLRIQKLAAAAPEIRAERVAELKEKINDPSYIDNKMVGATADRLIDALFS